MNPSNLSTVHHHLIRYQAAALRIQQELIALTNEQDIFQHVTDVIVSETDMIGAWVAVPQSGNEWLKVIAASADQDDLRAALFSLTPSKNPHNLPHGDLLSSRAFRTARIFGPESPQKIATMRAMQAANPALQRINSVMAFPIFICEHAQPAAVLAIDGTDEQQFTLPVQQLFTQLVLSLSMALTRIHHHQELEVANRFNQALFDTVGAIGMVINKAGEIVRMNQIAEQFMGYTLDEVKDQPYLWERFIPEDERSRIHNLFEAIHTHSIPRHNENHWISRAGEKRLFHWINTIMNDSAGSPAYLLTLGMDITEQKAIEQAVRAEAAKNRAFLQYSSDGIHILNEDGRLIEASHEFCAMLGYSCPEMIGMHPSDWDVGFSAEQLTMIIESQFANPNSSRFETRHRRKDGSVVDVEVSGVPIQIDNKRVLFNSARDITERKATEAALNVSLSQANRLSEFNILLAKVNQIIANAQSEQQLLQSICDVTLDYTHVQLVWIGSPDKQGWFGIQAAAGAVDYVEELHISASTDIPEGQGPAAQAWRAQDMVYNASFGQYPSVWMERAKAFNLSASLALPVFRGKQIWAILSLYHQEENFISDDLLQVLLNLAQDIGHGLDRLDAVIREQNANTFNAALLDNLMSGINIMRYPERVIEKVNARMLELVGASSQNQLIEHQGRELYPDEETYRKVGILAEQVLQNGQGILRDLPYRRIDGNLIYMDLSGQRLKEIDDIQRIVWTHVDVTERHLAELSIRKLSRLRASLLANTTAGIDLVRYPEQDIIEVNQAFLNMMGYASRDEIIGKTTHAFYFNSNDQQRMTELAQTTLTNGSGGLRDLRLQRKDGSEIHIDISGQRLDGEDEAHPVIVWTSIDVTDRHRLTEELAHQALFDQLTDLPNRHGLEKEFDRAIARVRRYDGLLAVGVLDLDDFKSVNDTYGHEAGDVLLREIARRFKSLIRETDLVARLGGDEFVVIINNLDEDQVLPQLTQALNRLHGAVEQPFEVMTGRFVTVGMTMGLALYSFHGKDADSLMREADAAMYQSKTRKLQRDSWWQLGTRSQDAPSQDQEMDIFGLDAAEHLRQSQPMLDEIIVEFVEAFYNNLVHEPEQAEILATLSDTEMQRLKIQQVDHLRFLVSPTTTRDEIIGRAQYSGRAHTLTGVNSIMLVQSYALYRHLLNRHLNLQRMAARTRYRLMRLIDERMQIDLHAQLKSGDHVVNHYHGISNHNLPQHGTLWTDIIKEELARLGHLPGILGAILMRPDSLGIFVVEHSAGFKADAIAQVLQSPESTIIIDPASPRGQNIAALAWRSNQIHSLASYHADSRHAFWQESAQSIGLRSVMAVPVADLSGHVVTLLLFYGAYPHQFETSWMRQFAYGLQRRWADLWQRSSGQATTLVISQEKAHILRDRLFSGGLSMFMQPIVDLKNGQVVKVEALARLIMPDGQVIPPGMFLPLLGDRELDQVFRQGLDQTLGWLSRWDMAGLNLTVSINLSPSTLLDPECPRWVADSLTRHDIEPERLYLELLETQAFDTDKQNVTIGQLVQQGIKISLDDLGSGYSSLKRLSTLPFDMIKVDQGLLNELYIHPIETLGLVTTIVNLGRYYHHDVTVEGLEDRGMFEVAAILGAQYGQGYTISRPMPADAVADWIRDTAIAPYAGKIQTLIGALAYQHHILLDERKDKPDITTCPVECFLVEQGLQDTDAYRWHARFHAGDNESGRLLLDWFAEQIVAPS